MSTKTENELLEELNGFCTPGTFQHTLGLRFVAARTDRIVAELAVREDQVSRPGVMHGGALMAFADCMGGFSTRINLRPGQKTTTVESKTNFLRMAEPGRILTATAEPLHRGRRLMVWETTIRTAEGKPIAVTVQTQMVLEAPAH
ncbi:PaaI family thioesterase [Leisingera daeponensis]|uniref:PaaI family thioesterase n=1 Tax=Leisingera daeponensis TaxID=405746 RepID=UPI001C93CD3F|nr:PaaI family thioesterase [Leisingera daeponensis]MBY6059408.1 PaaI family thioesterase [Leisingera daeponensis]